MTFQSQKSITYIQMSLKKSTRHIWCHEQELGKIPILSCSAAGLAISEKQHRPDPRAAGTGWAGALLAEQSGAGLLIQQLCGLVFILPLRASSAVLATFPHPEYHLSSPTHRIVYIFPVEGKWSDSAPSQKILVWPWMC